jgi:hypothetical protein
MFRPIAKGERLQDRRLTDRSVAKIVKAHAARAGLDPAKFGGHSLVRHRAVSWHLNALGFSNTVAGAHTSPAASCSHGGGFKLPAIIRSAIPDTPRYVPGRDLFGHLVLICQPMADSFGDPDEHQPAFVLNRLIHNSARACASGVPER